MFDKAILEIARSAPDAVIEDSVTGFSALHWQQLIEISRSLKIAPEVASRLSSISPADAAASLKAIVANNSLRVREHLTALKRISTCAGAEGLRFVAVKGLSHAAICRGDIFARQAGDIDLLVDTADLARCDYVLKKASFRQPASPSNSAVLSYASSQVEQYLAGPQRPYPTRPKAHSDQLHPYYAEDMLVKVEVHDGLHYIPQGMIRRLLWMTQMTKMGPLQMRTLQEPALLLVLIASTFQNSENIHARFDGEANLRDYIDLHCFFKRFNDEATYQKAAKLIAQSGLISETGRVLSNYNELFPGYQIPLNGLFDEANVAAHTKTFLERVFDKPMVRNDIIAEIKSEILPLSGSMERTASCVVAGEWTALENDFSLPVEYMVSVSENRAALSWRLPSAFSDELTYLAFQFGLILKARATPFEIVITFTFDNDKTLCSWQASDRPRQKLVMHSRKRELKCSATENEDLLIFATEIDAETMGTDEKSLNIGLGIIPMMFQKDTASEYRALNLGEECYLTPLSLIKTQRT